jgi:hypothetical protein
MFTTCLIRHWSISLLLLSIFLVACNSSTITEQVNTLESNLAASQAELAEVKSDVATALATTQAEMAQVKSEVATARTQATALQSEIAMNATRVAAANRSANEAVNLAQNTATQVDKLTMIVESLSASPVSPLLSGMIPLPQWGINVTYLDTANTFQSTWFTWFDFGNVEEYSRVQGDFAAAWGEKNQQANIILAWSGQGLDISLSEKIPEGQLLYSTGAFTPTIPAGSVKWEGVSLALQIPIATNENVAAAEINGQVIVQGGMLPSVIDASPFTATDSLFGDFYALAEKSFGLERTNSNFDIEAMRPLFLLVEDRFSGQPIYTLVIIVEEISGPAEEDTLTAPKCRRAIAWWLINRCRRASLLPTPTRP